MHIGVLEEQTNISVSVTVNITCQDGFFVDEGIVCSPQCGNWYKDPVFTIASLALQGVACVIFTILSLAVLIVSAIDHKQMYNNS